MSSYPNAKTLAPFLDERPEWLVAAATRFMERVSVEGDCWLWLGGGTVQGYGMFTANGCHWQAHRFSYELHRGPVPTNRVLDHLCRTRHCVNPDHLEIVEQHENIRRGATGWGGDAPGERATHCPYGHPYTVENTYDFPGKPNSRACRTCQGRRRREYEARRRGAA